MRSRISQCLRAFAVFVLFLVAMMSYAQSWQQASTGISIPGSTVQSFAVADLNGDGFGDVAAVVDGKIILLAGDGKGGLNPLSTPVNLPVSASALVAADFTGSGRIDLLVIGRATESSESALLMLVNTGHGEFAPSVQITLSNLPSLSSACSLAAGVFTSTGSAMALDFALSCQSAPTAIFVGTNDGAGSFGRITQVAGVEQGRVVVSIQTLGTNADGTQNLSARSIATSIPGGAPRVDWLMNQSGVFSIQEAVVAASSLNYFTDYDGDGITDSFSSTNGALSAQRGQASGFEPLQTVDTWAECGVVALGAGHLQNNPGSAALDLVAATLCPGAAPSTGYTLSFVPMLNGAGTSLSFTSLPDDSSGLAAYNIAVTPLLGTDIPTGNIGVSINNGTPEVFPLSNGSASFQTLIPDASEKILAFYGASDQFAASATQTVLAPTIVAAGSRSSSVLGGSAGMSGGPTLKSNFSAQPARSLPAPGYINTIAGNGTYGYSGDGGAATSAKLAYPEFVAVDSAGDVIIPDTWNNRIREVSASTGIISTIIGNGIRGYSGDGGSAINAELYEPTGIVLDSSGNIYFAEGGNQRVRKVTISTGVITTIAGNGTAGYSGDGGLATNAELNYPSGIAIDSAGNVYIADQSNNRIRKVTASTGIISTIAGNGTAGYSGDGGLATSAELNDPDDVALDRAGNIYLADSGNNLLRMIAASSGVITTVAGTGAVSYNGDGIPATSANVPEPLGIALDPFGNLYISDGSLRVRKVTVSTGMISTVAGNGTQGFSGDGGPATSAELDWPGGVRLDTSRNLYIVDGSNDRIRVVTASKVMPSVSSAADGVSLSFSAQTQLSHTMGQADGDGWSCSPSTCTFTNEMTIYGPYTTAVSPGNYVATFALMIDSVTGDNSPIAHIDVTDNYSQTIFASADLTRQQFTAANTYQTFSLPFTLTAPPVGIELRTQWYGNSYLKEQQADIYGANPSPAGLPVVLSAAIGGSTGIPPTGAVTFYDGGTSLGTVPADSCTPSTGVSTSCQGSGATATLLTSMLEVGSHSITAQYSGDSTYSGVTSGATSLTITQGVPEVYSWPTASPILYGQTLASSTLSGGSASVPGVFVWSSSGVAPSVGTYSESVVFQPSDSTDYNSVTGSVSITVTKGTPTVSVSCSPNPLTYGSQNTTCTTTVSGTATGTVTWTADGGAWTTTNLNNGTTSAIGWSGWNPGSHNVGVTYNGDSNNNAVSASVTLTINQQTPSISLACTPNPLTYGSQTTNCTVTLGTTAGGSMPTGTATWTINGSAWTSNSLSSGAASAGGFANYAAGNYTIGVTYSGNGNFTPVNASTSLTINKQTPNLSLLCSPNPIIYPAGTSRCTLTVSPTAGGGTPSGGVTWTINGNAWTNDNLSGGSASEGGFAGYLPGNYAVEISYAGDTDYNPGTTSTTVTVSRGTPTISAVCSPNPVSFNSAYSCSATVSGSAGVTPSGSVTWPSQFGGLTTSVSSGSSNTGSRTASVSPDTYSGVVTYNGDSNWNSESTTVAITVQKATSTCSAWPSASVVTYGQPLSSSVLSGGSCTVPGTFAWTAPSTAPGAGSTPESVSFTPADTTDYNSLNGTVNVLVARSLVTVLPSSTLNPSTYGQIVTWTFTVAPVSSVGVTPTGSLALTANGVALGSVPISAGVATFTSGVLPAGTNTIAASYSGDSNYQ